MARSWVTETKNGASRAPSTMRLRRKAGSGRLLLEIVLPLAEGSEPVHLGAVRKGALGGGDVLGLAGPRLLRRRLQGAAVAEGELPREAAEAVHGVEMRG